MPYELPNNLTQQAEPMRKILQYLDMQWNDATSNRSVLDQEMSNIQNYVRPLGNPFNRDIASDSLSNRVKARGVYDTTAIHAANTFASYVYSATTPENERWHELTAVSTDDERGTQLTLVQKNAIAELVELGHGYFRYPKSGFSTASHEALLDTAAYGNDLMYGEWDPVHKCNSYSSVPFSSVYFTEDMLGRVSGLHIRFRFRVSALKEYAAKKNGTLPQVIMASPDALYVELRRSIVWRETTKFSYPNQIVPKTEKPWAVYDWLPSAKWLVYEGGFDERPFFPSRYYKYSGDVYGIGPAKNAMPNIRNANAMMRDILIAGAMAARPPWSYEDTTLIGEFKELLPGQLLPREPGSKAPEMMPLTANPEYAIELLQAERRSIMQFFSVDKFEREQKKERQTLGEVVDERDEMLRGMAPILVRNATERLTPLVLWHYNSLMKNGAIPERVQSALKGLSLRVSFVGPAVRAMSSMKVNNQLRFFQDMLPITQVYPEAFDRIDLPKYVENLARHRDVAHELLLGDKQQAEKRAAREKDTQAMMQTQQVKDTAGAIKDLATAREKGFNPLV